MHIDVYEVQAAVDVVLGAYCHFGGVVLVSGQGVLHLVDDDIRVVVQVKRHEGYLALVASEVGLAGAAVLGLAVVFLYLLRDVRIYLLNDIRRGLRGIVALDKVDTHADNGLKLLGELHALCESHEVVVVGVVDDVAREVLLALILVDIHDKAAVYLHDVGHECQQVADVGISRSVIVYRDLESAALAALKQRL